MVTLENIIFGGLTFLTSIADGGKTGLAISRPERGVKIFRRKGTMDRFIVWEVWKYNEYKIRDFEIKSKDIVLDIGGQIGAFAVYAAKKAKFGRVYSFEPFLENYRLLAKNKKENKLPNLRVFNTAVSGKSGYANFYPSASNTGAHSMVLSASLEANRRVKTPTISLEDLLKRNKIKKADYLKIDVEGGEYKIILNTKKEVLRKIEKIVMEYHAFPKNAYTFKDLKNYLESAGFRVKVIKHPFPLKTGNIYAMKLDS